MFLIVIMNLDVFLGQIIFKVSYSDYNYSVLSLIKVSVFLLRNVFFFNL